MFPTLDIVHQLGFADHIWLRYQDIRAKLLAIEHRLETEFFSPELMDMLRTANALNKWDMTFDTAKLFENQGYKNKKQAGGYFF